ncbi:hypothetical protein [Enterococcus faecium]|uniref:hypothetical protein n=1 Tax=Enterococcus faecium TaxID=1352 RepID=UPI001652CF8B|nr:hypothetical protein [Enterococcus faecium]
MRLSVFLRYQSRNLPIAHRLLNQADSAGKEEWSSISLAVVKAKYNEIKSLVSD